MKRHIAVKYTFFKANSRNTTKAIANNFIF